MKTAAQWIEHFRAQGFSHYDAWYLMIARDKEGLVSHQQNATPTTYSKGSGTQSLYQQVRSEKF